jgi:hypothetical protein
MTVEFQLQDFLGFPATPIPADQLEKLGIPSFSWEFPMIFHRGNIYYNQSCLVIVWLFDTMENYCMTTVKPHMPLEKKLSHVSVLTGHGFVLK